MSDEIRVSVMLKPDVHARLKALAKADGRSLARYIEALLGKHLAAKGRSNA